MSSDSSTRLVLEPPAPFINANQRLHWRKKMELTRAWRELARAQAAFLVQTGVSHERVHVFAHFRFPDNKRRDVGNWFPTVKAALDGAVSAGLIEDDSDAFVVGPDLRREYPNGLPRLVLEFVEVTP